jgi:hypothetical protein
MPRLFLLVLCAAGAIAHAGAVRSPVHARAVRRPGPIVIDGRLGEPAWAAAPRQTGFTKHFPKDGAAPAVQTSFAILYDDKAIYVGVWADDPHPELIRALLTRRDLDTPADTIAVGFDSYHDRRTAFVFQLDAAGVQRDMLFYDDVNQDDTWDAVWTGGAAITAHGWTAEFRIPLSQLRYTAGAGAGWGLQVIRMVGRTQEQSTWSPWPRTGPQIVSTFGVLDGLDHLRPARRLELLPYVLGGIALQPVAAGDPLDARVAAQRSAGLDLKYGLGPAFTLSATINPDFGQVEADPSQVNLSANELFFAEKRPFFLEGNDLFRLPIGNSDGTVEGAFYSRRIGAAPPEPDGDYAYVRAPSATPIYGAAKLTGKQAGWSVGLLDAVTGRETAMVADEAGTRSEPVVAPLTNYAVARVKRDLRDGKTSVGMSATAVERALGGTGLEDALHDQAYTAGVQIQHRWAHDAWQLQLHALGSLVHGTAAAIADTQQDNLHLYQRPDARNVSFDPARRTLTGLGATWKLGRLGDTKRWRYGVGGDLRTAGLELNDLGFQTGSTNQVIPYVWAQYHQDQPSEHVLNWQVNADLFTVTTLEPRNEVVGLECDAGVQLPSYWQLGAHCNISDARWDVQALRGGPALRTDPNAFGILVLQSDTRKQVSFNMDVYGTRAPTPDMIDFGVDAVATLQARSNITVTLGPSWYERVDPMQYIDQVDDTAGRRHYVFGRIHQTTGSLTARVDWTFSPHLSLQIYAQPFIAAGRYSELKDVDHPHAARFADRFHLLEGNAVTTTEDTISIHDGASYRFDRPDFDLRALRSTVVLRWEYRPGSTVFAIWSHDGSDQLVDGRLRLGRDLAGLVHAPAEDVVMVKANYWVGL